MHGHAWAYIAVKDVRRSWTFRPIRTWYTVLHPRNGPGTFVFLPTREYWGGGVRGSVTLKGPPQNGPTCALSNWQKPLPPFLLSRIVGLLPVTVGRRGCWVAGLCAALYATPECGCKVQLCQMSMEPHITTHACLPACTHSTAPRHPFGISHF